MRDIKIINEAITHLSEIKTLGGADAFDRGVLEGLRWVADNKHEITPLPIAGGDMGNYENHSR